MSEEHTTPDQYQTRALRELMDHNTGADKQRQRAAVNKLLSLNGGKPIQEPKYVDKLTAEMMKFVDR